MSEPPSLHELLDAVQAAVDATSYMRVGREIGLTPRGVKLLLQHRRPTRATLRKIALWHAWRATGHESPREAEAAIAGLAGDFPPGERERVMDWLREAALAMRAHAMETDRAVAAGEPRPSAPEPPPIPDLVGPAEAPTELERSMLELFGTPHGKV